MANDVLSQLVHALASGAVRVVDLSQKLGPDTPVFELPPQFGQSPPLTISEISRYDARGPGWYWNTLNLGEHTGTHFDAPVHWISGKDLPDNRTDTIPPQRFVAPACVIDMAEECAKNADFLLMPAHVEAWESKHGRIEAGSWVLLHSGWSKREGKEFLNVDDKGQHSPGPHPDTVRLLAAREVIGFGTEAVGTDAGQAFGFDPAFPSHTIMHGSNRFGLASLTNLDQLPPKGAVLITPPLKIVDGSGSPCRVLALVAGAPAALDAPA